LTFSAPSPAIRSPYDTDCAVAPRQHAPSRASRSSTGRSRRSAARSSSPGAPSPLPSAAAIPPGRRLAAERPHVQGTARCPPGRLHRVERHAQLVRDFDRQSRANPLPYSTFPASAVTWPSGRTRIQVGSPCARPCRRRPWPIPGPCCWHPNVTGPTTSSPRRGRWPVTMTPRHRWRPRARLRLRCAGTSAAADVPRQRLANLRVVGCGSRCSSAAAVMMNPGVQ